MGNEWILKLKVGDKFVIRDQYGSGLTIHKVTKITEKQIVSSPLRFWKNNGRAVGSSGWYTVNMEELDDNARTDLIRQRVRNMAHKINYNELSLDQLNKIYDALKEVK